MKAFGFRRPGDVSVLEAFDAPLPTPGPRDLRVAVRAVSVNPVDTKVRTRATPPEGAPRILGWDAAGVVEAVGSEVGRFKVGDEVYYAGALGRPGTNAEFHLVDERIVGHKPASLSFAEAAALPLTSITAWELLFDRLGVRPGKEESGEGELGEGELGEGPAGDALLVIGGAGGVGSILVQIARRLTELTVVATASRPDTIAWSESMGAHHVVDHRQPLDEALRAAGIPEARYVASLTATEGHLPAIVRLVAPQGAMAVIDDPERLDVVPFKAKSVAIHWELMFTRSSYDTPDLARQGEILDEVARLVDAGVLRTTLTNVLGPIGLENLRQAHKGLESGRSIGKVVLEGF